MELASSSATSDMNDESVAALQGRFAERVQSTNKKKHHLNDLVSLDNNSRMRFTQMDVFNSK